MGLNYSLYSVISLCNKGLCVVNLIVKHRLIAIGLCEIV